MQISRRDALATGAAVAVTGLTVVPLAMKAGAVKEALLDFLHGLKGSEPGNPGGTSRSDGGRLTAIELRWAVIVYCVAVWDAVGWLVLTSGSG